MDNEDVGPPLLAVVPKLVVGCEIRSEMPAAVIVTGFFRNSVCQDKRFVIEIIIG
jgi:hypothetical protein